ncbi:myrosinase 1-like [Athalia rosae]|uniref:myrosinase 1-like n=1 Tax=Athalia rosae TaxID=37344 RepID=UPI0020339BA5|nr:myrosinase 1-like [Athalia rosae]
MRKCLTYVLCLSVVTLSYSEVQATKNDSYFVIPEGLKIGVGTSSYQVEGGWNASDKGENVWDRLVHSKPWMILDETDGDLAADSYNKYKEDVHWVKRMKFDHYRISLSWARILPTGLSNSVSREGLRYYHNLIDELLANNIEPLVTIYHWDHPQVLEDMGGWTNHMMVKFYLEYANVVFREFGDKVKVFTTLNELQLFCLSGYGIGEIAPGKPLNITGAYLCGHNALKAHAEAYHLYNREYRSKQNGRVGIVSHCASYLPKTPNDTLAAEIAFEFSCGWISHPIYIGDYPKLMKDKVAQFSKDAGFTESQLPVFSPAEIARIKGTSDYFGMNHYTSFLVEQVPDSESNLLLRDSGIKQSYDPSWEITGMDWLNIVPHGFGYMLRKIKAKYNNPPVYVTENGSADNQIMDDHQRIKYHFLYLRELLSAVYRDNCNVQKYTAWSLVDCFEWSTGYAAGFGLLALNMSSPARERIPKLSASWFETVMGTRKLQPPFNSTLQK